MTRAYIALEVSVKESAAEIAEEARKIPYVTLADRITGPYDVIVVVEAADISAIGWLVMNRLNTIPGVLRTNTWVAIT